MLKWALIFLIVAITAGLLGFGGVAIISVGLAKIAFFIFLALSIISLILHFIKGVSNVL